MTANGPRETIEFDPNVVQRIALKYKTGRIVQGRNGIRVMFTTTDDRVFFLDQDIAQLIYDLRLKPGAPFTVCRRQSEDGVLWEVRKLGEQADGTFLVERGTTAAEVVRLDQELALIQQRREGAGAHAKPTPLQSDCLASYSKDTKLASALKTAVLAAFAAGEYAKTIGYAAMPQFTSEDLRTMANTLMIGDRG